MFDCISPPICRCGGIFPLYGPTLAGLKSAHSRPPPDPLGVHVDASGIHHFWSVSEAHERLNMTVKSPLDPRLGPPLDGFQNPC
eukprot:7526383-Pyramimonas_sp.AAC.1